MPAATQDKIRGLKGELLDLLDLAASDPAQRRIRTELAARLDRIAERAADLPEPQGPQVRYRLVTDLLEAAEPFLQSLQPDRLRERMEEFQLRNRSLEIDDFGMDPAFIQQVQPLIDFLYDRWFRVETVGTDLIPSQGRAILVSNHSGTLPYDSVILSHAVLRASDGRRLPRFLMDNTFMNAPFAGPLLGRGGMVRASQENARRLLDAGEIVGVFPEGMRGLGKLYRQRYQLQRFGRGGFVKLAVRTRAPIIPVAIVGAEEILPVISRGGPISKLLGFSYFPVTPFWPLFGPAGLVPLPTRWKIRFGRPVDLSGYSENDLRDEILVTELKEQVRANVQEMLYDLLKERKSVFGGIFSRDGG